MTRMRNAEYVLLCHRLAAGVHFRVMRGDDREESEPPPFLAAGGAVGSTAVQLARWAGAEVIGTGRSHSRSLVLDLGADRFVALDEERLEDAVGQADLVFDAAGGQVLAQSAWVVKPGGTLVSVAAFPPFGRQDAREIFFIQESSRAQLTELARRVDEGHLRPQVGAVYPLADAAEAYSAKAAGGIPGRIVLQP